MPAYLLGVGTNKIKAVHVHQALGVGHGVGHEAHALWCTLVMFVMLGGSLHGVGLDSENRCNSSVSPFDPRGARGSPMGWRKKRKRQL